MNPNEREGMGWVHRGLTIGFGALLFVSSGFQATSEPSVEVEARVSVAGGTSFHGIANATASIAGAQYETGKRASQAELVVETEGAHLRVLNFPWADSWVHTGPVSSHESQPWPTEVWREQSFTGRIELTEAGSNGSYRVLPLGETDTFEVNVVGPRNVTISAPGPFTTLDEADSMGFLAEDLPRPLYITGAGGRLVSPDPVGFHITGNSLVLLYGGTFTLRPDGETETAVETGQSVNHSRTVQDPAGVVNETTYDRVVLVIQARNVRTHLWGSEPERLLLALQKISGSWRGDFAFAGAAGDVHVGGQNLDDSGKLLQFIGEFQGQATYGQGPSATWQVAGPATFVGVDGVTAFGSRLVAGPSSAVAKVAGATALLAALAYAVTHWGQLVGAFYARFGPDRSLDHPGRRRAYEHVCQTPGVKVSDLAQALGWSVRLTQYHLRVLERTHKVAQLKQGRAIHVVPRHALGGSREALRRRLVLQQDPKLAFALEAVGAAGRPLGEVKALLMSRLQLTRRGALHVVQRGERLGLLRREGSNGPLTLL